MSRAVCHGVQRTLNERGFVRDWSHPVQGALSIPVEPFPWAGLTAKKWLSVARHGTDGHREGCSWLSVACGGTLDQEVVGCPARRKRDTE